MSFRGFMVGFGIVFCGGVGFGLVGFWVLGGVGLVVTLVWVCGFCRFLYSGLGL